MIIYTIDYIPKEIIPRYGYNKKELTIMEKDNYYVLNAKKCRKEIRISKTIELNENDIIAIGLYLAEGTKSKIFGDNRYKHNGEVGFSNSDPNSLEVVCRLFEKFGVNRQELRTNLDLNVNYKDKFSEEELFNYWMNKLNLSPNSKRNRWIRDCGVMGGRLSKNTSPRGCLMIGYSSVIFLNIFIPFTWTFFMEAISRKDEFLISLILKGYFAGDGHVNYSTNPLWCRKQVEFLCNDHRLRSLLREGLTILSLKNIRETYPLTTKTHTHSLRIYNKPDFLTLQKYSVLNFIGYKKETFAGLLSQYKR